MLLLHRRGDSCDRRAEERWRQHARVALPAAAADMNALGGSNVMGVGVGGGNRRKVEEGGGKMQEVQPIGAESKEAEVGVREGTEVYVARAFHEARPLHFRLS